ncbi:MAG: hypothetical protein CM15mP116_03640 [Synechococcus sp.]|nr:MAG: hypothetical protein CM15mP116_03640 [Synechococcus sp.]
MLKGLVGINTHACSITIPVISNSQSRDELGEPSHPFWKLALRVSGGRARPLRVGADLDASKRHLEILEFLLKVKLTQMQIRDQ